MKKALALVLCVISALVLGWAGDGASQGKTLENTFKEESLGYTISYPGDWTYAYQAPHIVVFGTRTGKGGGSTISLRNLNSTKVPGGKYKDSDAVIETLMNQLKKAKNVIVYEPEPYLYNKGQTRLMGKQLTAEYTLQGEKYKQWVVVVPRMTGDVFHLWSFVSPAKSYDALLPTAQAILGSWTIR